MIIFSYYIDFKIDNEECYKQWIQRCIEFHSFYLGDANYIFCNDNELHKYNIKYLGHDDFTDVITFDYTKNKRISADIFISVERVRENAKCLHIDFLNELKRVMIHGILHCMGFQDKTIQQKRYMRLKENECINFLDIL